MDVTYYENLFQLASGLRDREETYVKADCGDSELLAQLEIEAQQAFRRYKGIRENLSYALSPEEQAVLSSSMFVLKVEEGIVRVSPSMIDVFICLGLEIRYEGLI
jgi:hypothetical protein